MSSHLRRLVRPALCAATLAYFIIGNVAHAATYEVASSGSDANAGTAAQPWKTLQKASNTVKAGDTVLVNNGTYAGFRVRTSGTAASRIVFKAKTKWGAKINTPGPSADVDLIAVLSASYVTIDGFEVFNSPRAGVGVRSWFDDDGADTRDNIVQNCFCHDNGLPSGGAHDGIFTGFALNFTAQDNVLDHNGEHGIYISNSADNPIVRRNISSNNRACGIQLNADLNTGVNGTQDGIISNWLVENNVIFGNGTSGGAGINLDGDINGICRNNLIYNNLASGIAMYQIDGGVPSQGNLIVNNTIYNPNSTRGALVFLAGANNNVAFNNIFISGKGMDIDVVSGFQHDYNIVSSFVGASASAHESAATAASLFVSVAGNDYHLAAASPALNSGVATFGGKNAPATDLENHARPSGAAFDRGCYETPAAAPSNPPQNISVTPAAASSVAGVGTTLSSVHRDLDGVNNISYAMISVGATTSAVNVLRGYYNAVSNKLYLRDDANSAWLGGFAPGSANVIANSQGKLDCALTTVGKQGNDLTIGWRLIANAGWAGTTQKVFLFVRDKDTNSDGWDQPGTWQITAASNAAPVNVSLSPNSGSSAVNTARLFTSDVRDANGAADLSIVLLRATSSGSNAGSLVGYYNLKANKLYLLNDAGNVYTGGFAPGSANMISNSQGSLNCAQCSVSINGTHLTVNWSFTPSQALSGQTLNLSLYCKDASAASDGWDAFGTWHVN